MKSPALVGEKFILICALTALMHHFTLAQKSFSSSTPLSQSVIIQWTGDNGLISNNVTSAIQSKSGFIWITTYNGIMRFDGKKVDVYDRTTIPFLSTDSFYGVYEDRDGTLWFAAQGSGIVKYQNGVFTAVDPEGKFLPKSIRCLLLDPDGTTWVGSNNNGLYHITEGGIQKIDFKELNNIGILDITKDKNNNLWIATDGNGVVKFDGKTFDHLATKNGLLGNTVDAIVATPAGDVWIGTTNGLNRVTNGKLSKVSQLENSQINEIICDEQNVLWVGTELGLARLDLAQNRFEFLSEKNGYPLGRINTISFDNENSLWVSTGRNGLVQLKETNVTNITTNEGLNTNKTNIIVEGENQTFYIGSDVGGVDLYQDGKIKKLTIKTSLADAGIRDIYVENPTTFWIASYRGVLKLTNGSEKLYTIPDGLPANDVRRLLIDRGDILIATRSGGIARFRNGKVIEVLGKDNKLESNYILSMEKDNDGNIFIGTHSGGMSVIRTDGTITTYHIKEDDAGMLIFNIHIDDQNRVWIVTNIGPYFFDGKTFKRIELTKIAKGETYFDWVEDAMGSVWITTNIGVLKIKKSEIESFLKGEIPSVNSRLFDNQDGMKSKECTGATRSLLASSGAIWVPTIGGIAIFYPEKTKENNILPPVYITSLVADGNEVGFANASISPGKLRYTFSFTAPSFIAPGKISFQYKLDPVDANWIPSSANRQAEYTNLSPGNYTFRVMASNSDGLWNKNEAALSFTVEPFFYQTYWFYLTCILIVSGSLYGIYRWRLNEVERRNEELRKVNSELDRFVYSASHDLRAPLASILGLVNIARIDKQGNIDDYLEKIERSVNKLDGFVKDIIDFSRNARIALEVEPIHFDLLIHEVIDDLKYLDDKNQIKRIVAVHSSGPFLTDRKRLTIILSNLVSNAIKYFNPHAKEPFLEIIVNHNQEKATITVRDNGIGIAAEHVDNIFKMFYRGDATSRGSGLGLYIVKETLEKINGKIDVKSTYGEGSTFIITLPSLPPSAPADNVVENRPKDREKNYSNYP